MSESTVRLTPESIEEITRRIAKKAPEIEYEVTIPDDRRDNAAKGASLLWARILECEYEYIDSAQDSDDILDVVEAAGLDIDSLMDDNEALEVDSSHFPNYDNYRVSMDDFRVALFRAIESDLSSAWMNLIREEVKGVHGEDPLEGGGGLRFPASED